MRRAAITAAVLATVCLAVAGCSGSPEDPPPEPTPMTAPWPLTGVDTMTGQDTAGVVAVKIENTPAGRPQVGVGAADVVVEQLVEGGLTRLVALYHSQFPTAAAPVRSMRETDIGIVLPTGGTLAASGGAGSTVAAIEAAGVPLAVEGAPGFSRDPGRRAPFNVTLDVAALSESLPPGSPPAPYLPFGAVPEAAAPSPADTIALRWPSSRTAFAFDPASGRYVRSDLPDASGFAFTNVIAVSVPVTFAGGTDSSGTRVPTMVLAGSGAGSVATGGSVYDVAWSKPSLADPWQFTFAPAEGGTARQPFTVPAGRTWLALLPVEGGSASFAAASPAG